jgi:PPOX class probable F420-dependent enzyme
MIDLTTEFGRAVSRHLDHQYIIWLTTIDRTLTPQPRPVWFLWDGESILIFSKPDAYKVRHVRNHPNVSLHFNTDETGDRHVIILTGKAIVDPDAPPAYEIPSYMNKYESGILGLDMTPTSFSAEYSTAIRITPMDVRGWE